MTSVNATTFLEGLRNQNKLKEFGLIEDIQLDHRQAIRQAPQLSRESKVVSDCEFQNFVFDEVTFSSLTFERCRFKNVSFKIVNPVDSLLFVDCEVQQIEVKGQKDVRIASLMFKGESSKIRNISVDANIGYLGFSFGKIEGISSIKSSGNCKCEIKDVEKGDSLKFEGSFTSITVERSSLDFEAQNLNSTNVDFYFCKHSRFYFLNTNISATDFLECTHCNIEMHDVTSKYISLYQGKYDSLQIGGKCEFKLKTPKKNDVESGTEIDSLLFDECELTEKSSVYLNKILLQSVQIIDSENFGTIQIRNSTIEKNLDLRSSSIRKTKFNNLTISSSCEVNIFETDLAEVVFDNFRWNNNYKLNEKYNPQVFVTELIFLLGLRESYRQLKALFNKVGNKIEALEFQKHELRTQLRILRLNLSWRLNKREALNNLGNFLILATHNLFSNFSQNVWRPLLLLFVFHLVLFNIFLCFNPDLGVYFDPFNHSTEAFFKSSELYFTTIFPTHRFELANIDGETVPIGGFWNFIMRISASYFIFYFISASRKYHQS